jgi:hypothetical protein
MGARGRQTQWAAQFAVASERRLGRPDDYPMTGFAFTLAEPFENKWETLPH